MTNESALLRNFRKRAAEYGYEFKGNLHDFLSFGKDIFSWIMLGKEATGIPASHLLKFALRNPALTALAILSSTDIAILATAFAEACADSSSSVNELLEPDPQADNSDKDRWRSVSRMSGFYMVIYKLKAKNTFAFGKASNVVTAAASDISNDKEIQWISKKTTVFKRFVRKHVDDSVPNYVINSRSQGQNDDTGQTSVVLNLNAATYHAILNSYFPVPCRVVSDTNGKNQIVMENFVHDFWGIREANGSLPEKGMAISGSLSGSTAKGTSTVHYYFLFS